MYFGGRCGAELRSRVADPCCGPELRTRVANFNGPRIIRNTYFLSKKRLDIPDLSIKHIDGGAITSYQLSSLANFYIKSKLKLEDNELNILKSKVAKISRERDIAVSQITSNKIDKYNKERISYRSHEDAICGKLLKELNFFDKN